MRKTIHIDDEDRQILRDAAYILSAIKRCYWSTDDITRIAKGEKPHSVLVDCTIEYDEQKEET